MRDDLLDAQASVDWAEAHLDRFRERVKRWFEEAPYVASAEENPQTGAKLLQVNPSAPLPRLINADIGAIINSIRTSLDLLATAIAQRHCKRLIKDAYFPICETAEEWDGRGHKRIKRLSATDQATIKNLQPCYGGDNLLLALNRLDNTRKHQRLLAFREVPVGVSAYRYGSLLADFDAIYRSQAPDDGYMLAHSTPDLDHKVQVRVEISFNEIAGLLGCPVEAVVSRFIELARKIIGLFDAP
jgi:hypothetical protein